MGDSQEESSFVKEMQGLNFIQLMQMASQPNEVNFLDNSTPTIEELEK